LPAINQVLWLRGPPNRLVLENVTMADISTDMPRWRSPTSAYHLKVAQLLLLLILACGCWAAINEATAKDRCQTTLGRLAVQLKLDSYYSNCQCMKPTLDLSDVCNLTLAVTLGLI
jgi:hypothetical protein